MYFYLFAAFLNKKKFRKVVAKIETRIVDLGIDGRITRLSVLKNMTELVEEAIKKGAKTIVIVGNDKTINQAVNIVADTDVTLGFIPVGDNNRFAKFLGIPLGDLACDVLSSRLIETLDLGKINNQYFFSSVKITGSKVLLECDGNYQIIPSSHSQIVVCNFGCYFYKPSNPKDGFLETIISTSTSKIQSILKSYKQKDSLFFNKKIGIKTLSKDQKSVLISVDEIKILKTPAIVEIIPQKLKIIVGKKRMF